MLLLYGVFTICLFSVLFDIVDENACSQEICLIFELTLHKFLKLQLKFLL